MSKEIEQWVIDYLKQVKKADFYGSVVVQFKAGEIYLIREERTIRPPKDGYVSL